MLGLVSAPSHVPQSSHSFYFTSTETALGAAGLTAAVAVFSIWINQRSATTQRRDEHIQADHTRFLDQRRETYLSILRNLKGFYEAAKFLKYVLERMTKKPGGDDHLKRAREQLWESGLALEEVRSELAVIAPKPVEDASAKIKDAYRDSVVAEGVLQSR
jgi:hypothetical protein